ncbi:hypothetical protein BGW80DRAFT_833035 [Lactifluus volemus]|nr:hypothetical protein BGW80DRAFT_833035 [Lactifluus volemus]
MMVWSRDGIGTWGRNFSVGAWRPPALEPWKSFLLLSGPVLTVLGANGWTCIRRFEGRTCEKRTNCSLNNWSSFSKPSMSRCPSWTWRVFWTGTSRPYGTMTVFPLPYKIETLMKDLVKEFRDAFPDLSIPSLPQLLATISGASSNHFYATVVKSNDSVPMFHDVVRWMLQRDLLVTLHLRVRTVVPAALKARARRRRDERHDRRWHTEEEGAFRSRSRRGHKVRADSGISKTDLELFDPSPAWYMRRNAGAAEPPMRASTSTRRLKRRRQKHKWRRRKGSSESRGRGG